MAIGNTFGATALSSYGGFWIAVAITFTPGGFEIMASLEKADHGSPEMFYDSFGLFLFVSLPSRIHAPKPTLTN
jgi:succinate-acetate transporter protein